MIYRDNYIYMKRFLLLFAAVLMCVPAVFATGSGDSVQKRRPTVALVLCGGGAKGAAHIGAIKVLEEANVPIDMIVGTSIGGLVGGMYAMGYNAAQLDSIVASCDWGYLLSNNTSSRRDASFERKSLDAKYLLKVPFYKINGDERDDAMSSLPSGLISGQNVLNFLNGLSIGYQESMDFRNLPIPFACVAADLSTGEALVLKDGELPVAMRATMAIPGVFSPVEIDGKVLVDGGIINNFPVDVAREMGADIVIGVDIQNDPAQPENLKSVGQILNQMISLMGNETYLRNREDVDIMIKPDVSKYGTYSFNKHAIEQLIENGYVAAKEQYGELDELARRLNTIDAWMEDKEVHKATEVVKDTFCFSSIELRGVSESDGVWLKRLSGLKEGEKISGKDINRAVSILMGTRTFSSVSYVIHDEGSESESLVLNIKRGPTNVLAVGARYDSEEAAAVLLHLGVHEYDLFGSKLGVTARLSYNPYGEVSYSYTSKKFPKVELSYKAGSVDMNIYKSTKNQNYLSFIAQRVQMHISNIYIRNFDFDLGVRYEYFDFNKYLTLNVPEGYESYSLRDRGYLNYFLSGEMDNRDDSYFASRGMVVDLDGVITHSNFKSDFSPFLSAKLMLEGNIPLSKNLVLIPSLSGRVIIGDCNEVAYLNYVGGEESGRYFSQQLPFIGINYANVVDNNALIGRIGLRHKIYDKHYLYGIVNYLRSAHSFETLFTDGGEDMWGAGIKYAYSSPIGPISFNVHWSDYEHRFGVYVSLGHYF